MGGMDWLRDLGTGQVVALVISALVALLVVGAVLTRVVVQVGLRTLWVVRLLDRLGDRLVAVVKRPITIMVLDEVAAVIQTGHYTRNISDALLENHDELKDLVAEKVRSDPKVRLVGRLPGYDTVVSETTEMVMRVLIDMLGDPRTDELVSDLLRNNLQQIRRAVRDRDHESVEAFAEPDPLTDKAQRLRARRWGTWGA